MQTWLVTVQERALDGGDGEELAEAEKNHRGKASIGEFSGVPADASKVSHGLEEAERLVVEGINAVGVGGIARRRPAEGGAGEAG